MDPEHNNAIKKLDGNPLFHLSMSSLELFHSNFIFWFSRQFPRNQRHLLFVEDGMQIGKPTSVRVSREKGNVDLLFEIWYEECASGDKTSDHAIVVENKFKSLPAYAQLKRYEDKAFGKTTDYVLLSLSKCDHLRNFSGVWNITNYRTLAERMRRYAPTVFSNNSEGKVFSDCYLSLIETMHDVFHEFDVSPDEPFVPMKNKGVENLIMKSRFESFLEKRRAEQIAYMAWDRLFDRLEGKKITFAEFSTGVEFEECKAYNPKLFVSSGLTRAQGIIDLKYRIDQNLALGIQIQGNHYRHLVEGPITAGGKIEMYRDKLADSTSLNWFDMTEKVNGDRSRLYPKAGKEFNRFGGCFFYRSYSIEKETVKEVIDSAVEDLFWVHNQRKEILGILGLL